MPTDWESRAQSLSALADGELDEPEVGALSAAWRDDGATRARWHAYQLIGDVLRSDELASSAEHDAEFMARLRSRLAAEPVVLAPGPSSRKRPDAPGAWPATASERRRRRTWIASSAIAAGFVMVVVATLAIRVPGGGEDSAPQLAQAARPLAPSGGSIEPVSLNSSRGAGESAPVPADAKLIRDARLDRYLAAHKEFSGTSVLGVPSGFLRDSASDAPTR